RHGCGPKTYGSGWSRSRWRLCRACFYLCSFCSVASSRCHRFSNPFPSPASRGSCRRYCHTSQQPGSAIKNEIKKNQPHPTKFNISAEGGPDKTRPNASKEDNSANCVAV